MAQKVSVLLVDDLDGGDATEIVTFGLDGTLYEMDLSEANAKKLRGDILPYVEHARKAGTQAANGTPKRRRNRKRSSGIRTWAREQGYQVSEFGRISPAIVAEYDRAHS